MMNGKRGSSDIAAAKAEASASTHSRVDVIERLIKRARTLSAGLKIKTKLL